MLPSLHAAGAACPLWLPVRDSQVLQSRHYLAPTRRESGQRFVTPAVPATAPLHSVGSRCVQLQAGGDYRRRRTSAARGIPGVSGLQDLWRKRLYASAVLIITLVAIWCLVGIGKFAAVRDFNATYGRYLGRSVSTDAALEDWLFGTETRLLAGRRVLHPTMSRLENDFIMDRFCVTRGGQFHRLFSATFLHAGIIHLICNVGFLFTMAPLETGARGPYLVTYFLAGIGGCWAFWKYGSGGRALGASGSLCGLLGYELVSALRQQNLRQRNIVLKQAFGIAVMGLLLPGVDNWGHLGGFFTGVVLSFFIARRSGSRRPLVPWQVLLPIVGISPPGRQFLVSVFKAVKLGVASPGWMARGLPYP